MSDPSSSEGPVDWTNDAFSEVKRPEKRGCVRFLGKIPIIKEKGGSSFSDTFKDELERTQGALNTHVNLIKEHISIVNLSRVINDINIEVLSLSFQF